MKMRISQRPFSVDQSPQEVFDAINDVRGWWSEEIEGRTDKLGAEFKFQYKDFHRNSQKITDLVPGKKVVWHISNANLIWSKTRPSGPAPKLFWERKAASEETASLPCRLFATNVEEICDGPYPLDQRCQYRA